MNNNNRSIQSIHQELTTENPTDSTTLNNSQPTKDNDNVVEISRFPGACRFPLWKKSWDHPQPPSRGILHRAACSHSSVYRSSAV